MKDLKAELEKLLTIAEDCELIARLATDKTKCAGPFRGSRHSFAKWRLNFGLILPRVHPRLMATRALPRSKTRAARSRPNLLSK